MLLGGGNSPVGLSWPYSCRVFPFSGFWRNPKDRVSDSKRQPSFSATYIYTRIKDDIFMGLFPPKIKKRKESIILHKHRDPCQEKKKEKKQLTQKGDLSPLNGKKAKKLVRD